MEKKEPIAVLETTMTRNTKQKRQKRAGGQESEWEISTSRKRRAHHIPHFDGITAEGMSTARVMR
jgi:hypothetical protein